MPLLPDALELVITGYAGAEEVGLWGVEARTVDEIVTSRSSRSSSAVGVYSGPPRSTYRLRAGGVGSFQGSELRRTGPQTVAGVALWTALGLMETPEFGISPPVRRSL